MEKALEILIVYAANNPGKKGKKAAVDVANLSLSSAQIGACWKCGEPGHKKQDCPKLKANKEKAELEKTTNEVSHAQT